MKKLSAVLLAGLLAFGSVSALASCGPTTDTDPTSTSNPTTGTTSEVPTTSEDPNTTVSQEEKVVARFKSDRLSGPVLKGESVDLSEYITVVYADDTEDKNFTVAEADGYVVNGTTVTFEQIGDYNILISAGTKTMRFAVKVESLERRTFNSWFSSIEQNYTVYNVSVNQDGSLTPTGFCYHNNNEYFTFYFGSNLQHMTAKLSDGNYYAGTYGEVRSPVDFDFTFNPGVQNWNNSYGSVSLQVGVNSTNFSSSISEDGYEVISADAGIAEDFMNYSVGLTYGGDALSLDFFGFADEENTAGLFGISLMDEDQLVYDFWLISDIGTTSVEILDTYCASGALPSAIPSSYIDDAFESYKVANNYTMAVDTYGISQQNQVVKAADLADWQLLPYFAGTQVTYVTEDSVVVTSDGQTPVFGYTTVNDAPYMFSYTSDSAPSIVPVENSFEANAAWLKAPTCGTADIAFESYQEVEGMHVFAAPAGSTVFDASGKTIVSKTDTFAHHLLSSAYCMPSWASITDLGELYCNTAFLSSQNDPDHTFSMSEYLDLQVIVTSQGIVQVTVMVNIYILLEYIQGVSVNGLYYWCYEFTFGNVGTTTAPDISAFTGLLG